MYYDVLTEDGRIITFTVDKYSDYSTYICGGSGCKPQLLGVCWFRNIPKEYTTLVLENDEISIDNTKTYYFPILKKYYIKNKTKSELINFLQEARHMDIFNDNCDYEIILTDMIEGISYNKFLKIIKKRYVTEVCKLSEKVTKIADARKYYKILKSKRSK